MGDRQVFILYIQYKYIQFIFFAPHHSSISPDYLYVCVCVMCVYIYMERVLFYYFCFFSSPSFSHRLVSYIRRHYLEMIVLSLSLSHAV